MTFIFFFSNNTTFSVAIYLMMIMKMMINATLIDSSGLSHCRKANQREENVELILNEKKSIF